MKILFVATEVVPFSMIGGLSQVMYFLPKELIKQGHDVRVFSPKYGSIDIETKKNKWTFKLIYKNLKVPTGYPIEPNIAGVDKKDYLICNVKYFKSKKTDPDVYLLENREYYELRANVYGYGDDHIRFYLLSKSVLEYFYQEKISKNKDSWFPDIIHCNDWHTSYVPELIRGNERYKKEFLKTAVVTTIHNFSYQGNYDFTYATGKDRDDGVKPLVSMFDQNLQKQNSLLRGIKYSDAINTVSPTHATEVLTPKYSSGLHKYLQDSSGKINGILNGLDTIEFNPATDPIISTNYAIKNFVSSKKKNKLDLQRQFNLPLDEDIPVIVSCGRLSIHKGMNFTIQVIPKLFELYDKLQIIILGGNDQSNFREALTDLKKKHPDRLGLHLRGNFRLPRKLYAGGDIILIPSLFEPGGIVALEALRYGCIPIVHRTGGLNDIVRNFNPNALKGNGFAVNHLSIWTLFAKVVSALTLFEQKKVWSELVKNALESDFSWEKAAKEYNSWYQKVLISRKRALRSYTYPQYKLPT